MEDDYTPEQKLLMMGPGFGGEIAKGLVTLLMLAILAASLIGVGIGWLVFG